MKTPGGDESPLAADQSKSSTVVDQKLVFCERKHWPCQSENDWTEIEMCIYIDKHLLKYNLYFLSWKCSGRSFLCVFECILGLPELQEQTKATCCVDYSGE